MKVERKEAEFKPVTLILETQEEVDVISDLIAKAAHGSNIVGSRAHDLQNILSRICSELAEHSSNEYDLVYLTDDTFELFK